MLYSSSIDIDIRELAMGVQRLGSRRFDIIMASGDWVVASGKGVKGEPLPLVIKSYELSGLDLTLTLDGGRTVAVTNFRAFIPALTEEHKRIPEKLVIETLVPRRSQVQGGEWADDVRTPEAVLCLVNPFVRASLKAAREKRRAAAQERDARRLQRARAEQAQEEQVELARQALLVERLNARLGGQATVALAEFGIELTFPDGTVLPISLDVDCACDSYTPSVTLFFDSPGDGEPSSEDTYTI